MWAWACLHLDRRYLVGMYIEPGVQYHGDGEDDLVAEGVQCEHTNINHVG